jgi:ligand-binding sensor domain-containing protein
MFGKKVLIALLSVTSIFLCNIYAQVLNFEHYSVDKGLPSSQVFDITQDKNGNLWFATDQGISKYDGYSFKNYSTKDGLTDNMVFKFHPQVNGDIWCTTFNKSVFCIRKNTFTPYPYNNQLTSLPDKFIPASIYLSTDGSFFMSVLSGKGYIHIDKNGKVIHNDIKFSNDSINHETGLLKQQSLPVFFLISEKNKRSKISGNWDHVFFSGQSNRHGDFIKACFFENKKTAVYTNPREILIKPLSGNSIVIDPQHEPISLGTIDEERFWVGYRYGGVAIFDLKGKQLNNFLLGKSVTSLFIDHEGAYWFSTLNDGIFKIKSADISCYPYDELKNNWINSLTKDRKGNLWIGYYNGDVSELSGKDQSIKQTSLLKKPALVESDPLSGKVIYSSDEGCYYGEKKISPVANPLCFYFNDSILYGSYSGLYVVYKEKRAHIPTGFRVNDICYHKSCFYLAGNKGLYKLQNNKAELFKVNELPSSIGIKDIDQWNKSLVLATHGAGIFIMNENSNLKITESEGLSNNIINEIYVENENIIWACTNSGLNRIAFNKNAKFKIDVISSSDGLISNEVTDVEVIRDTAWVGTRQGLCSFPLKILEKKRKEINYFLRISDFKVNDKSALSENGINLKYDQNRIEFNFGGVSFSSDKSITYRYQLIGHESNWNYTSSRSIMYTSLPPGSYTFCVQAKINNNTWELGQQRFNFVIAPPFWKTWWFIVSVTVFVIALIYLFFRFRILSYNRDITRELLRQLLKRLTKKTNHVVFREKGKDIRISTNTIHFVRSDDNYIEIHTDSKKYVIRYKIGDFLSLVPDPLEYLRISRSCIVRLDKVQEKSKKDVTVKGEKIPVGETYLDQLPKIKFQA